jgi:hypothetical protein
MRGGTVVIWAIGAVGLLMATPASAGVLWQAGYADGTLNAWHAVQEAAPDRLTVVPSPTDPSENVMRVEVRQGDVIPTGGTRAEVYARDGNKSNYADGSWPDGDGTDRYYGWRTYIPAGFPNSASQPTQWQIFTQWERADGTAHAPLVMDLSKGEVSLETASQKLWHAPMLTNTWDKYVAHIHFSSSSVFGFVALWRNGVQVLPQTAVATEACCVTQGLAVNVIPNYLKMGLYRDPSITQTSVLYQGPMKIGADYASVAP